jgi:hypothetical protein
MGDNGPTSFDSNDFDLDACNISKVIMFLQNLARNPNASAMNMAFTTNSFMILTITCLAATELVMEFI